MRVRKTIVATALTFLLTATSTHLATARGVSGTLPGYQTAVERETIGELSEENLRQASLLGSQVLLHLNGATRELEVGSSDAATGEIDKALTLVGVIRDLLPVTVETTVVKDPDGKEIYHHTERSQDDLIPIYQEMTAVEVVQPILDANWDRAAIEGVRLDDVELIHTSVRANLSYLERRLRRAKATIQRPDEALTQLRMAQAHGLRFSVNKTENPLLDAQRALRLAEKMAEDGNFEAADANLVVARNHLTLYRNLVPDAEKPAVKDLQKEIEAFEGEMNAKSPGVIRGFWRRVTGWMSEEPGQATATDGSSTAENESS